MRDTPLAGFHSNGAWLNPVWGYWGQVKQSKTNRYRYLSPYFSPRWDIDYSRRVARGIIQAALTWLEVHLEFPETLTLRSARTWFSTCDRQLLFRLEDQSALGHWGEGRKMPNLYDRAVCATELNLRNRILQKIHSGRASAHAFEAPEKSLKKGPQKRPLAESPADSKSIAPTASFIKKNRHF